MTGHDAPVPARKPAKKPPKKPKSYHHGDLRPAILEAAVALIAEGGVENLSLRECARRAGVSHAAPYRHFASKAELVWAIAAEGFEKLAASGRAAIEGLTDPDARIDAYGAAYVRFAFEHPVHHRVMFTTALEPPEGTTEGSDGAFQLLVETASRASPGVRPDLAALASWSLPHGLSMLILDGRVPDALVRTGDDAEKLAREVIAHWRATR